MTKKELKRVFVKEFIKWKNMYNGNLSLSQITRDFDITYKKLTLLINELIKEKFIQIRNCDAFCYELTKSERNKYL